MTYKHSGTTTNSAPSLFGEAPASAATDKTISILSAVAGRETATAANQKKGERSTVRRYSPLFLLLLVALGGLFFWQQSESGYDTRTVAIGSSTFASGDKKQPAAGKAERVSTSVAGIAGQAAPEAIGKMDVAVIETVTDKTVPVPVDQAVTDSVVAVDGIHTDRHPPLLARSNTLPTEVKVETEKKAAKKNAVKSKPRGAAKTVKQTVAASPIKSKQVAARTEKTADADERLLEAMLRLVNRDAAKNGDKKSAAK